MVWFCEITLLEWQTVEYFLGLCEEFLRFNHFPHWLIAFYFDLIDWYKISGDNCILVQLVNYWVTNEEVSEIKLKQNSTFTSVQLMRYLILSSLFNKTLELSLLQALLYRPETPFYHALSICTHVKWVKPCIIQILGNSHLGQEETLTSEAACCFCLLANDVLCLAFADLLDSTNLSFQKREWDFCQWKGTVWWHTIKDDRQLTLVHNGWLERWVEGIEDWKQER